MVKLQASTSVLVGPRWRPGTVTHVDQEGVHVMTEDGDYGAHDPSVLAIRGHVGDPGEPVLVEVGERWVRGELLDVKRRRARVRGPEGDEWFELDSLAGFTKRDADDAKPDDPGAVKEPYGARLQRFSWTHGPTLMLAFAALGPVFLFVGEGGWTQALAWIALHGILAAYIHAGNRSLLPRFVPAGFGKPDDPGATPSGFTLEQPPTRGKWEVGVFLVAGWMIVGVFLALPNVPPWPAAAFLVLTGVVLAITAFFYDRGSADEARRLLAAPLIRDGAAGGEVCVTGTVAGDRKDAPALWRQVLLYTWSVSRQVEKTITDEDGHSRTVQETQTSHYACGYRREAGEDLTLDTPLGPVEVPLRGLVWAAPRALTFGGGAREGWKPPATSLGWSLEKTATQTLERVHAGDRVAILGELERGSGEVRVSGGASGPAVMFAAGDADPRAVLVRALMRRRLMLATMIGLALVGAIASLVFA